MNVLDEPDRLHGAHVPIRRGSVRQLQWWEPTPAERVRVLAWTCDCQARFYELCQSGGMVYIRRTVQKDPEPEISETHRWPVQEGWRVWFDLLTGEVR
ncbi:hypothetical protein [Thermobispora bispora]|uniref:Uncharacterized protein n=1 Tax=Thermobispora bispora (strain ATCC 19993 / DSM 43833 / CBS 139.67 / JCM 10125 / KCTC 9307 / NBRC 14880 / R51) TaxID=469371 RepID=D6Y3N8_THEBD|nr:hypothetical protein [Thermobispora bispora]ADG87067.1 hypothetical protein Tbis_0336 [Thermobispora bispora DSM 43833]MBX6167887.1 hypothetical protein [Thermobispora bispora]